MRIFARGLIILLCLAGVALAYESERGYRVSEPQGWLVADQAAHNALNQEVRQRFANLKNVQFDMVDVFICDPEADGFAESVNVVVTPGRIPLNEQTRQNTVEQLGDMYRSMGLNVGTMTSTLKRVGNNDCLEVTYEATMDGNQLRQWQFLVPGKRETYIVSCTCLASDAATYEPTFRAAMSSFAVVGGSGGGWSSLPPWLRFGVIGGLVGGGIGALGSLLRRKKGTPASPSGDR